MRRHGAIDVRDVRTDQVPPDRIAADILHGAAARELVYG
jgi:hypothetical protein